MRVIRKKSFWGILVGVYFLLVLAGTVFMRGRSLQEWVIFLIPPGQIQELLLYPLQNHHPLTFSKLIVLGDIIANIFLFIPLGMIIFLVFDRIFLYPRKYVFFMALLAGAGFSIAIELVQYMVPNRIPSVFDVCANIAGALLGCSFFYIRQRKEKISLVLQAEPEAASEQNRVSSSTPQP